MALIFEFICAFYFVNINKLFVGDFLEVVLFLSQFHPKKRLSQFRVLLYRYRRPPLKLEQNRAEKTLLKINPIKFCFLRFVIPSGKSISSQKDFKNLNIETFSEGSLRIDVYFFLQQVIF